MTNPTNPASECCPPFNPARWDGKTFEWKNKPFVKAKVCTLFYMPMNFKGVMKKLMKNVETEKANTPDSLCLSDHTSKWNMDVYMAVDKKMEGLENVSLSGKFKSKVYEGPFQDTGKWCKDFENEAKRTGVDVKKWYMWYTTCPACAKKYGKNYVVIIAQIG